MAGKVQERDPRLGSLIRKFRQVRWRTLNDAHASGKFPFTKAQMSRYETGNSSMTILRLRMYISILELTPQELREIAELIFDPQLDFLVQDWSKK